MTATWTQTPPTTAGLWWWVKNMGDDPKAMEVLAGWPFGGLRHCEISPGVLASCYHIGGWWLPGEVPPVPEVAEILEASNG